MYPTRFRISFDLYSVRIHDNRSASLRFVSCTTATLKIAGARRICASRVANAYQEGMTDGRIRFKSAIRSPKIEAWLGATGDALGVVEVTHLTTQEKEMR